MPLYDYQCQVCHERFEAHVPIAQRHRTKHCGKRASLLIGASPPSTHIFKPMWAENIDSKPVYVESKKQYKQECKKRGKLCLGLM